MDSFEINKIVACVLVVALVFIGLANFSEILYHVEKPEVAAYQVEGAEDMVVSASAAMADDTATAEPEIPIQTLLASADISSLSGLGGSGSKEDYKYSNAMAAYGGNWTYEQLNGYLLNPKKYIEGTKMSFVGLKKEKDRANVILYLRSFSDNPAPIE